MISDTISRGVTLLPVVVLLLSSCGGSPSSYVASSVGGTVAPTTLVPPCGIEGTGAASFSGPISQIDATGHVTINGINFSVQNAQVFADGAPASVAQLQVADVVTVFGTFDQTTNSGCANTILSDANVAGAISAVDLNNRSFNVIGQQVFVNSGTLFGSEIAPASLATLQPGDVVRASGLVRADGAISATRIDLWPGLVGYEATGGVANLDASRGVFQINQITVRYQAATLVGFPGDQINDGDPVRVIGTALASVPGFSNTIGINATRVEAVGYGAALNIALDISLGSAEVEAGGSIQFTANHQTGVTWAVSDHFHPGSTCPPVDCGTIDATGKYFAPMNPTTSVDITATWSTGQATVVVWVIPPPDGIGVSPTSATVQANGVAYFTAYSPTYSLSGFVPLVQWTVSGTGCAGASCGTISSDGQYIAPAVTPNPPVLTVTATSMTDSSQSGSATVMLGSNPNNAKLKGSYAFLLNGSDGDGFKMAVGSFTADGNGNITAAIEDTSSVILEWRSSGASTTTGTYSVDSDNRGSLTLPFSWPSRCTPPTATPGCFFVRTFSFALGSFVGATATRGRINYFNEDEVSTGVLVKQDPAAFSTAAIKGDYAFSFSGTGSGINVPLTAAGRFTASGGSVSTGIIDVNDGGTAAPTALVAGSYSVDQTGRGIASLAITGQPELSNFVFYVVSAGELLFMQTDDRLPPQGSNLCSCPAMNGTALQQSGEPFSVGSLNGPAVLNLGDVVAQRAVAQETFDGNGKFSGSLDENNQGVITSNAPVTGSYTVDADGLGHGTLSVTGDQRSYAFYLVSPGRAFIIDSTGRTGTIEPQTGGPFDNRSVAGNYIFGNSIRNYSGISGALTADGLGGLVGTFDGPATGQSFTGTYAVAPNGRSSLTVVPGAGPAAKMVFYLVSPSKAAGFRVDPGGNTWRANITMDVFEK
jgi:Domain of unknown function (DUF5666)